MLFSSVIFIVVFLPAVLFFYYVAFRKSRRLQNAFLLIASLGFYAWGEPWFVLVMMLSILGNYIFGLLVDKNRESLWKSRLIITLMLVFNLTIIFIFKYLMFTIENINSLIGTSIEIGEIALPIGISFFTFQAISYVIDIYRQKGQVQRNLLNVGLYISFFPQLIAGPIVRYETVSHQIMHRRETFDGFSSGLCRFIVGMAKKVLLANNFAIIADQAFSHSEAGISSVAFAWMGAIAYTLQIYFDFSGYSDMAIGLGRMFGFKFPENFRYPYISKSISEFWRRWHISLGSWFRDYVYFPLGGSRVQSKSRLILNLFVVWALTGLWHGANWTFITWGLLYFVLISAEKLTGFELRLGKAGPAFRAAAHIYTMFLVILGWVLFRANDIASAVDYIQVMFGGGGAELTDKFAIGYWQENRFYFIFGIIFSLPVAEKLSNWIKKYSDAGATAAATPTAAAAENAAKNAATESFIGTTATAAAAENAAENAATESFIGTTATAIATAAIETAAATPTAAAAENAATTAAISSGEKAARCTAKVLSGLYPVIMLCAFIFSMAYLIKGAYNPFIYFNF